MLSRFVCFRLIEGGEVVMHLVVHANGTFAVLVGNKERREKFDEDFRRFVLVQSLGELKSGTHPGSRDAIWERQAG